jgi:CDP-paratose 2-epimerase
MRVMVTGGCGFVGFNLASSFLEIGHQVLVLDNLVRRGSETNVSRLRKLGIPFIHGDIRNTEDLDALPAGFDCLVECSAQPSVVSGYENPLYDLRTNLDGVIHCLELCRKRGMGMIFLSSSRIYSSNKLNGIPYVERESRWDWDPGNVHCQFPDGFDPINGINAQFSIDGAGKTVYGVSKAAADLLCQEYSDAFGIPVIVNRCGVIAGEGQFGVVNQGWLTFWALSCLLGRPVTYLGYKGKQVRDVLFIQDLCKLLEIQLDRLHELGGKVWNVGGGRSNSLSLLEATDLAQRLLNKKMVTKYSDTVRRGDVRIYYTDNSAVSDALSWSPSVSLDRGLERVIAWLHDNRDSLIDAGL